MSVPTQHTTVVLMLCVTTPGDPITARAKMDFVEMEKLTEVTIAMYLPQRVITNLEIGQFTRKYNTMQCNGIQGKTIAAVPLPQCHANLAQPIRHK